ncbi:cutinase family protein [Candidatus Saccharibacteria bacterium]|nr:cutinase family protein [Candidatus Saccharibacteria bacterium]
MPTKLDGKKYQKYSSWWRYGGTVLTISFIFIMNLLTPISIFYQNARAESCSDVKIIFARGSGEERWGDQNYRTFKTELETKLKLTSLKYEFDDLDYPAIGVGDPLILLTTFVSGGEAYEFGKSVNEGVQKIIAEVNSRSCPNTKFVLAGYSQGAMVVSKALKSLNPDKVIYAATFGDPKIYLPEGSGAIPDACKGKNLSNYRIYVPDCMAYEGMLGSYRPYQPEAFIDKVGTWCNHTDFFCSSHFSVRSHTSYVSDGIYSDASKLIFDKITRAFGVKNNFVSLHDTAILIDSTGSMSGLIEQYKAEALRLAKKTLNSGGRVALFDYRDLDDPYEPTEYCNFETCTMDSFEAGLNKIEVDGGGDEPESLLSAGLHIMKKLNWKFGSTKSVVVLTDATYHSPDLDGTTFDEVVALSKKIDPVNFYIITPEENLSFYETLALATDGKVTASTDDLAILTDEIITRYDSLPRVEEATELKVDLPEISDIEWKKTSENEIEISFSNTGKYVVVALNDALLGMTENGSITLTDLDLSQENNVVLIPLSDVARGRSLNIVIAAGHGNFNFDNIDEETIKALDEHIIPKAPNTGKR